jgi:hypothetical protein
MQPRADHGPCRLAAAVAGCAVKIQRGNAVFAQTQLNVVPPFIAVVV